MTFLSPFVNWSTKWVQEMIRKPSGQHLRPNVNYLRSCIIWGLRLIQWPRHHQFVTRMARGCTRGRSLIHHRRWRRIFHHYRGGCSRLHYHCGSSSAFLSFLFTCQNIIQFIKGLGSGFRIVVHQLVLGGWAWHGMELMFRTAASNGRYGDVSPGRLSGSRRSIRSSLLKTRESSKSWAQKTASWSYWPLADFWNGPRTQKGHFPACRATFFSTLESYLFSVLLSKNIPMGRLRLKIDMSLGK